MISEDTAARLSRELASEPLRVAVLFGSFATGRTHPESDVDIAILPRDLEWPLRAELALQGRLASIVGRDVDLVRLDRADALVCKEVAQHGRPLFEERPGAFAHFAARAMVEYLDLEPTILDARRRFLQRIARGAR